MALMVGTNSYISNANADLYFDDNINFALWAAIDEADQDRALITASQQISLFVIDECKLGTIGTIPPELEAASAELALAMNQNPDLVTQGSTGTNVKKVEAGSAKVTFFRPLSGSRFPDHVMNILRSGDCLASAGAGAAVTFASGTGGESTFCPSGQYDLIRGYP